MDLIKTLKSRTKQYMCAKEHNFYITQNKILTVTANNSNNFTLFFKFGLKSIRDDRIIGVI